MTLGKKQLPSLATLPMQQLPSEVTMPVQQLPARVRVPAQLNGVEQLSPWYPGSQVQKPLLQLPRLEHVFPSHGSHFTTLHSLSVRGCAPHLAPGSETILLSDPLHSTERVIAPPPHVLEHWLQAPMLHAYVTHCRVLHDCCAGGLVAASQPVAALVPSKHATARV